MNAINTNVAAIKARIKTIGAARVKLVDNIQTAALEVTQHAHLHGDVTLANTLVTAVGAGMKQTALLLWLQEFGPFVVAEKAERAAGMLKYSKAKLLGDESLEENMTAAAAKPWHDYKTEKDVDEFFNVAAALKSLLNKADKGKVRPEDAELLSKLRREVTV